MEEKDLISISLDAHKALKGNLVISQKIPGIVVFAHGSGSGRKSPRNRFVAQVLQHAGLSTLLIDLLTLDEEAIDEKTRQLRFDIPLLAQRLTIITDWIRKQKEIKDHKIGYFGASTGAAAALIAAAERKDISAVVSRGGRPDLAGKFLTKVQVPTLLIIGSKDEEVIQLNEEAFRLLNCEKKLVLVPNATHLFEEPGTLEKAAHLARDWFTSYLQ